MIKEFVDRYMENKEQLREKLTAIYRESYCCPEYSDIVRAVVEVIHEGIGDPNPSVIHEI